MAVKVLVLYYSTYGHMEKMAHAAAEGARKSGADVVVKRVPETVPEEIAKKAQFKLDQPAPVATIQELKEYDAIKPRYSPASPTCCTSGSSSSACPIRSQVK